MNNKEEDFDFGFTIVPESDFKLKEDLVHNKIEKIRKMITPLLMNLKKDADKNEYIYWPNRSKKIDEFIAKLDKIINS
ncbi:MAG: hypothetical protein IM620_08860 [Cytophagales bacterium]|nr:hypothetical protein [Cytophagales bacterium]